MSYIENNKGSVSRRKFAVSSYFMYRSSILNIMMSVAVELAFTARAHDQTYCSSI